MSRGKNILLVCLWLIPRAEDRIGRLTKYGRDRYLVPKSDNNMTVYKKEWDLQSGPRRYSNFPRKVE